MSGTPYTMEKNGKHGSSVLILLLIHVLRMMPKTAISALMTTLGLGQKRTSATELLENILYMDMIKTFRIAGQVVDLNQNGYKVENWLSALNPLPFTLKR